ncbi:MAG: phosphate acyltransferase PlsX [Verrucomicrobia bacterium]|nr:phosphate acyltransferase PlsX [Verrucomicrobiota bacterium]
MRWCSPQNPFRLTLRIGVDLLGGDRPQEVLLEAAQEIAPELASEGEEVRLVLFGLGKAKNDSLSPFDWVEVTEEVTMEEDPLTAVRRKKRSSIAEGMRKCKSGQIDAFISTGNTGALVANSIMTLGMVAGVDRPGLLACVPSLRHDIAVIDVGGNINPRAEHLWQYARMGSAYQRATLGLKLPRVGLLNIGREAVKGTRGMRDAYQLLQSRSSSDFTFVGNIEGREAFLGDVDVIVCNGFAGNIFLKTAEGISLFILQSLQEAFGGEAMREDVAAVLGRLNKKVNYAEYPGALVAGVDGVVMKCHGFSSKEAVQNGIRGTVQLLRQKFLFQLKEQLATHP